MKEYFAHLRPAERRLVIGVGVVLFLVINGWLVWPHFSDWGALRTRLDDANRKLTLYQKASEQIPKLQLQVNAFSSAGDVVAPEDQGINLMRTLNAQAAASGVSVPNYSRQITQTNDLFFIKQVQNINVIATDAQLIDFLYKLGSDASMISVSDLELQPDGQHYHLNGQIKLVANYRKNSPGGSTPAAAPARNSNPPAAVPVATPAASATAPVKPADIFKNAKRATNSPVKKP
jgi:hypothetical protein